MSLSLENLQTVDALRRAGCVFAEEEAELLLEHATGAADLESLVRRRTGGEPLEHVIGWVQFCGRRIAVDPGVFVPRRRTEFLVDCAAALSPSTVLDLCCGSGAVGASISGVTELHAADLEAAAVACAAKNLAPSGGTVHRGDLYDALPTELRGRFDAIVVNAPYVPTADIEFLPREARIYEPILALDGGGDGVEVHRRVASGARQWLSEGGHLLVEASLRQSEATAAAFVDAGLTAQIRTSDDAGGVVVIGTFRLTTPVASRRP